MGAGTSKREQIDLLTTNFDCRTLVGEKIFHFLLAKELLIEEEPAREKGKPFPLGGVAAWISGLEAEITARDRVNLRGKVEGKACFYGAVGPREIGWQEVDFKRDVDIPGALPGMEVNSHARVSFIGEEEPPLEAEGKLLYQLKIEVEVFLSVVDPQQLEVATGVKEIPPERISRGLISAEELVKEDDLSVDLTAEFELGEKPAYVKPLNSYIKDFSWELGKEGLNLKGELVTVTYFLCGNNGEFKENRQQFSRQIPFPQLKKGSQANLFPRVVYIFPEASEQKVRQKVNIDVFVRITRAVQQEVITDIQGVSARKESLLLSKPLGTVKESLELVQKLSFPYPRQITSGFCRLPELEVEPSDGTIIVSGTIEKNIYYLSAPEEDFELEDVETQEKLPFINKTSDVFQYTLYLPGTGADSETATFFAFGPTDFAPTENETLQISHARLEVKAWERQEIPVVVPYRVEPGTSFVIYAAKPGDTLLKIARSYGVKPEALAAANDLEEDASLQAGQKLLIPLMFYSEL